MKIGDRDQMDTASDDADASAVTVPVDMVKDPLAGIDRSLGSSELKNLGVVKMLLHRVAQAERNVEQLENFRKDYYEAIRNLSVERTRISVFESVDKTKSGLLAVGSLSIGFIPSAWPNFPMVFFCTVVGALLIFASWHRKLPEGKF